MVVDRPSLVLVLLTAVAVAPPAAAQLRAGAARVAITPDLDGRPVYLAGFGQNRRPESIHDDLWARALVLESGGQRWAFVALDLIGYMGHRIEAGSLEIERRHGVPAEHVVVSSSHTHHGPDTIGIWGPRPTRSGVDGAYLDAVDAAIVEATGRAVAALGPARLRFGEVDVPEVLKDTRDPVVTDPTLRTLHLSAPDGASIAVVFVYAMHPEVLWSRNQVVTSDYPHFLRAAGEEALGGTALFFPGAIGGMQTPRVEKHDFDACRTVGRTLAEKGVASLEGAAWLDDPAIASRTRKVSFAMENVRFRVASSLGIIPGQRHLERDGLFGVPRVPSQLTVMAVGPLRIATLPGELFPELAPPIRERMKTGPRVLIGLAGNELGYILPREAWDPDDYEESMSLGIETGPFLVETLAGMLDDLERDVAAGRGR